eukprot:jgi/Mesvir1/6203/Mv00885-RA.2
MCSCEYNALRVADMDAKSSAMESVTLEDVSQISGVFAEIAQWIPLFDRIKLREAVDDSLLAVEEICREDMPADFKIVAWIAKMCPNIKMLGVRKRGDSRSAPFHCHNPQPEPEPVSRPDHFTESQICQLVWHLRQLEVLDGGVRTGVDDTGLVAIASSLPALKTLVWRANYTGGVSDAAVLRLSQGCPWLQSLDLCGNVHVSDASVASLGAHCGDLRCLNLERCRLVTDAGIAALAAGCPGLACLNLERCVEVTDLGVRTLAAHVGASLRHLRLSGCSRVTDAGLTAVGEACRGLEYLDVHECRYVGDPAFAVIGRNCPMLTHVNAGFCRVSDRSMVLLASGCPRLQMFGAMHCMGVTDATVSALAVHCRDLRYLNLKLCEKVTDVSVTDVGRNLAELRSLNVWGNRGITDASLLVVAAGCKKLQHVNVWECGLVTCKSVQVLKDGGCTVSFLPCTLTPE